MTEVVETPRAPETRTIDVDVQNIDTRGRTLVGYAAVYGAESRDLGGFTETIRPAAFARVMDADVRALLNHDPNQVLGRTRCGTLRLSDEARGLRFEVDLPTSPLGDNVREAVKRGDIDGASFRFIVGEEQWDGDKRTIVTVKELQDVTVATYGAYPDASVELRDRPDTEQENPMQTEDRTEAPAGRLTVEDRAQTTETPSVEERIVDGLRSVRKGEDRALTTAACVSPGELLTVLFDRLRAGSVVLATGIRTISTTADSVTYPTLTADVTPSWTAEGAAITPGDPTFATLTATPRKLAHLVQFPNEVLDDSDPSIATILNSHLLTALALKLDAGLLEGSGTPPEIRGLKNIAGIQTLAAGANGAQPTLDTIADAIALLEGVNVPRERMRIVMAPRNVASVRKLKASTGGTYLWSADPSTSSPTGIFGVPVYTSAQLGLTETQGTSGAVANWPTCTTSTASSTCSARRSRSSPTAAACSTVTRARCAPSCAAT